jgi:hypothetical protein
LEIVEKPGIVFNKYGDIVKEKKNFNFFQKIEAGVTLSVLGFFFTCRGYTSRRLGYLVPEIIRKVVQMAKTYNELLVGVNIFNCCSYRLSITQILTKVLLWKNEARLILSHRTRLL